MANNYNAAGRTPRLTEQAFRLAPLASAVAWMMAMGGAAQAQTAFSPAWFAAKGAVRNSASQTGQLPSGKPAGLPSSQQQSEAARQRLQQSITNLGLTAQAIAAEQARQAAARAAAAAAANGAPDGLAPGGLAVDTNSLTAGWLGAKAPVQTSEAGKTTVTIAQTDSRAILNWDTFNVGRNTTVQFQQQADWAVLNKVNDPLARPSQIQGQVKGDGTVLIVNRNGVVFTGTSQVNTRNLVAAAATITDDQFRVGGLYGSGGAPSFTGAGGLVQVQAGAQITTSKPTSVTLGGGYAMLLGAEVRNDGTITTPSGQTVLASGDSFTLRKGAGTDGNAGSTTVGNEVATSRSAGSTTGTVLNTGLITATTGDITLTGHDVTQGGVLVSTTSTSRRGTLHLSTRASDDTGSVTLAQGSTSAILLESTDATALGAQRDAALKGLGDSVGNQVGGVFDNLSTVVDRKDRSRIEIVSGNTVDFQGRSLTLATGGEVAVSAARRTRVDTGATLDVSGAVGVKVSMESNTLKINAQGNEQRDSVSNRDAGNLNNLDLWVDRRQLVLVPAGTNGYTTDRWYTAGGLLEVSGYVATSGHSVGEWMAQGGTVTVTGGDLVTRGGSRINLSGGTLDVAAGTIRQSWLKGSDGRLYEVSSAPADLLYTGLYQGFADEHARWGSSATQSYFNPLIAPQSRLENGYTVGRDAGRLVVATRSAVLEGTLVGDTYQGPQQTRAPQADLDGYHQSQEAAARGAQLIVGQYRPSYDASSGLLRYTLSPTVDSVSLKAGAGAAADGIGLNDPVAPERGGALVLDTGALNASALGGLRIAARSGIQVQSALQVADGGDITLMAPAVDVAADLTAHGGSVHLGNVLQQAQPISGHPVQDNALFPPEGVVAGVQVRGGVTLDASGRYIDRRTDSADPTRLAWLDGGSVSIRSTGSVNLASESLVDVSSGAAVQPDGSVTGGRGGSVQLGAGVKGLGGDKPQAVLTLDGKVRGHGVKGGGSLSIESASGVLIGGQAHSVDGLLKAGQTSQLDLIVLEDKDVQVSAGRPLPVDYSYTVQWAPAGQVVGTSGLKTDTELVLGADWMPPGSAPGENLRYPLTINGQRAYRGSQGIELFTPDGTVILDHIPAGSRVSFGASADMVAAFAYYVVPANVFPNGVPIEDRSVRLAAGSAAPADLTLRLAAGSRLAAGLALPTDIAVAPITRLSEDIFQSGFSRYDVRGHLGLSVADGVSLDVAMPLLRAERSALTVGTDLAAAFSPWMPVLNQADAVTGTLSQRQGASVSLAAGMPSSAFNGQQPAGSYYGSLSIGEGASVRVDPGQSISLSARSSLQVEGRLEARGGSITLLGPRDGATADLSSGQLVGDASAGQRAIVIGARAVLDASASQAVATDAWGRQYGHVTQGGSIAVGGTLDEARGLALASDAFVVVKEGAVLNASGGSMEVDLPTGGRQTLASDGGSIQLVSSRGVYLDGQAVARAGGSNAAGGKLTLALETPSYLGRAEVDPQLLAPRELIVSQQASRGSAVAGPGSVTGSVTGNLTSVANGLVTGHGAIGVDQISAGGFSSLSLYSNGILGFAGDVDLSLGRELRLYSAALAMAKDSPPAAKVRLSAPYALLSGVSSTTALGEGYVRPVYQGGITPQVSTASLSVQGQLVDVRGTVTLGLNGRVSALATLQDTRAGFAQLNLISDGDLRFIGGGRMTDALMDAELFSSGSILLSAGQLYPATGVSARVVAGRTSVEGLDPDSRLVVQRSHPGAADPALPSAAFGSLTLDAAHLEQNGVLRSPLGTLTLGSARTASVSFGVGSVTSISAAGLVMPYGGTADGVTYTADGKAVSLKGAGSGASISVNGSDVSVEKGAVLDLSGGGDLRGAGFVAGRGGSTDARMNPLTQVGSDGFSMPGLATNPVYAIVPGYGSAYAPAGGGGAVDPRIGQQITLRAGDVPGLPAGTYTLLPSNYALMPGAFRVELDGVATASQVAGGAVAMRNGSYAVTGTLSTANTGIQASEPTRVVVTSADVLRRYSQYNETGYADFITRQAALNGTVRAQLPSDAKTLNLTLSPDDEASLRFEGSARFAPAQGGRGGTATLTTLGSPATGAIEIVADGASPTVGFDGLSVHAGDLNALGAARLVVGGNLASTYGTSRNGVDESNYIDIVGQTGALFLREGAVLKAPEVLLVSASKTGGITVESGAGINTLGLGKAPWDASDGYVYRPGAVAVVAASNAQLDMLPAAADSAPMGSGAIHIGGCEDACGTAPAQLYSEGSLVVATRGDFQMADTVRYGTRNLVLAVGAINAGSAQDLAAAQARGALTPGLTLNQTVLDRLIQGDTAAGAPALQRLVLTAAESVNLFGNVSLNTLDPATGQSSLAELVLSTPALYGQGGVDDVARITTGKLVWADAAGSAPAPAPITGGRGSGHGRLAIQADVIEFGVAAKAQPSNVDDFSRSILGFSQVALTASDRITANHKGSLSVYESMVAGPGGPVFQGGDLTVTAPLVTGKGGSVNALRAGGELRVLAPTTGVTKAPTGLETGAELTLAGASVRLDTAVVLPSGKLTVKADGDLALDGQARLDLAGREWVMNDVSKFSWGGDVTLHSAHGNITQAAASVIDVSARNNHAGLVSVAAMDGAAGRVDLQGQWLGSASGHYDAGGTMVPYRAGGVDIRAQQLGDTDLSRAFAGLNDRLNAGGVVGERSFQLKQGDLTIGDELRARQVSVSLDGGHLQVRGKVDASGEQVGSIRLAAAGGLTVAGTGSLDAHGSALRVDGKGQVIESPNRASVVLDAGTGVLTLGDGARIDLRHGTGNAAAAGDALGTLALYAPRVGSQGSVRDADAATYGDIAIDARGSVQVQGARSIAVYGRQVYTDAPYGTDPSASGRPYQVVDQAFLDARHGESERFIDGALANADLVNNRLAGLNTANNRQALHLRPAVEITSATPDGDIIVRGDVDLSGQRYASLNPGSARTDVYGSGEVGMLTLRAGGDLSIHGSINDGFAPPPETPDDGGWLLTAGVQAYGGDVVVPVGGLTLADGTTYPKGKTLNYTITARNVTLPSGTVLPEALRLDQALTLPAGTVLAADVRADDGTVLLAAGHPVGPSGMDVPAGVRLMPGLRLPMAVSVAALTWPKGTPLPVTMVQQGDLALPVGALIASGTNVVLPSGAASVQLRTADGAGRQGRNWAVAQMLPAGDQSWSLALVAGADLEAADPRITNNKGTGHLTLADTHYGTRVTAGGVVSGLNAKGLNDILTAAGGLPPGISDPNQMLGLTEADIVALYGAFSWADFGLPMDFWSPASGNILMGLTAAGVDQVVNAAGGLPPGVNSNAELIGKTERDLVTLYGAFSWFDFGLPSNFWELAQGNGATVNLPPTVTVKAHAFSVLRTGTGDLTLAAGGDLSMRSMYGVYTAGTATSLGTQALDARYNQPRGLINDGTVLGTAAQSQSAAYEALVSGADSRYQAWYPDHGGTLTVAVGGHLTGDSWNSSGETAWASSSVGNWLWRQGTGGTADTENQPTAWWINFGTYAYKTRKDGNDTPLYWPTVTGFTGMGTLGGGNVEVRVGGDAGVISQRSTEDVRPNSATSRAARSEGLVLAVGSTGRVLDDGSLVQTGGGDLDLRIGGGWNSHIEARLPAASLPVAQTHELYGALVNLRGAVDMSAGRIGTVELMYGRPDAADVRAGSPYTPAIARATGGLMLMQGDAAATVNSRGDLVLGGSGDPGLVGLPNAVAFTSAAGAGPAGMTWFSLWTDRTALSLTAAGGPLALDTRASESTADPKVVDWDYSRNGGWYLLPGHVSVVAPTGNVYLGKSAAADLSNTVLPWSDAGLLLAPLGDRRIELLAGQSILAGGYGISVSGADSAIMATPQRPGFAGYSASADLIATNVHPDAPVVDRGADHSVTPVLAFGANTLAESVATSAHATQPSRFYALNGDIVGLRSGTLVDYQAGGPRSGERDIVAAGPVAMQAGRDIVHAGVLLDEARPTTGEFSADGQAAATLSGSVVVNTHASDVSSVRAGRDIVYANIDVSGPGLLEITAGRNLLQNDRATLTSTGPALAADGRPGAGIVVQAGVGARDPDYAAFVQRYLDTANLLTTGQPLADQPGKVVKLYRDELVKWLGERFDFKGSADEAVKFYGTLGAEQQRIFARQVFFAELRAGGREYNDLGGPRYGSYLRGRQAIAALFPGQGSGAGQGGGQVLMYGGAGIHTNAGGDIQVMTPTGGQTYGIEGAAPPATAGLITRGQGDIQLYALDSILLGQSRVMTTFGGDILAWSAKGDINAGRGAKTTLVFTPPRREYDSVGNVRLSPDVPSTGAGIATLNPLPEVAPGDVDLIAPLGTVDAGEAGIRVSGNVNIAALRVLNAANIQVKGESAGLPTVAAVNVTALTNASTAAATAATAAQEVLQREREAVRQQQPSVFTVRVLGTGDEAAPPNVPGALNSRLNLPYDPKSPVQIVGNGVVLDPALMAQLTEEERQALRRLR